MQIIAHMLKTVAVGIALVLLTTFGPTGHAAAMPAAEHEMGGMSHAVAGTQTCATLCRTAVIGKDETISNVDQEKDKDTLPEPCCFLIPQSFYYVGQLPSVARVGSSRPPPKVPIHVIYGVFRN